MRCPVMARAFVWFLHAVLPVLIVQGKHDALPLTAPEVLAVYPESDSKDLGVWKMNIEWKDGFTNGITPNKVTYDIKIFYTEQMKLVHKETIELEANPMGHYNWSWTSPLPLQCTSHSVQLRYREHDHTSAWTPLKTLPGKDTPDIKDTRVYPQNHVALVNEGIIFCCILKPGHYEQFSSTDFTIRISNRTYVTEPIRHPQPSQSLGIDIVCEDEGSTYYTGYVPDVQNLTCETRDLSTVECEWTEGQQAGTTEIIKATEYSINGRACKSGLCVLDKAIDTGVVNWTLTAKNKLGTKIIFDTADPKHRVHLPKPTLIRTTQVTARNATVKWKWHKLTNYSSFPMICQVELNGHIVSESFKGQGLSSVVLADLQPFTEYKARVRCGSNEHFYKWGTWSDNITFITEEDIPEAVDMWMQVFAEQTYVVWKKLNPAQSHGIITGYKLVVESSTDRNREHVSKSPAELCHRLQAGTTKTQQLVSIYANNSVGFSPASSITISNLSPGAGVSTSDITGNNGAFDMAWEPSPMSSCGYVLDWYPTYKAKQCAVNWIKIPPGVTSAHISSDTDFEDGVKYTLSVYACTSGAPYLLQRREGYMVELTPSETVQNLKAKQEGLYIDLSWENVPELEQKGFIKGYKVSYSQDGTHAENVVISDPTLQKYRFSFVKVDTYAFTVKAFTSAGDGPGSEVTVPMDPQVELVIINVAVGVAIMIFFLLIITVLVYRNREWLKSSLWPEVPKPMLSEEFLKNGGVYQCQVMDQLLGEEQELLKVKCTELCPVLTVLELQKKYCETQARSSPPSKDSPLCDKYHTPKSNPQTLPLITVDLSYQQFTCPGIQNPTYNLPLTPAADKVLASGYIPQTQNNSIQNQPSDAHWWSHSPSNI